MRIFAATVTAIALLCGCAHMTDRQKEQVTKFILDSATKSIEMTCDIITKKCIEEQK